MPAWWVDIRCQETTTLVVLPAVATLGQRMTAERRLQLLIKRQADNPLGTWGHSRRVSLRLTNQLIYLFWVFNGIEPGARKLIHAKQRHATKPRGQRK